MIFERENVKPLINPSDKAIALNLKRVGQNKKSTFASITSHDGSWLQVGGGGIACVLEFKEINEKRVYRAWQDKPIMPIEFDGAIINFGNNQIKLNLNEWFNINQVIEVFTAFKNNKPFPSYIHWRDITDIIFPGK